MHELICHAMCAYLLAVCKCKDTISASACTCSPQPATVWTRSLIDFAPESLFNGQATASGTLLHVALLVTSKLSRPRLQRFQPCGGTSISIYKLYRFQEES